MYNSALRRCERRRAHLNVIFAMRLRRYTVLAQHAASATQKLTSTCATRIIVGNVMIYRLITSLKAVITQLEGKGTQWVLSRI